MPKLRKKIGEVSESNPVVETKPETKQEAHTPKYGRGEIFVCKVRDGLSQHHHVVVRHPEEIITTQGARATKAMVVAEFVGSKFVCKDLVDMTADEVSKALHKHRDYGIEFWSLSDPVAAEDNPHVDGDGLTCLYCGRDDFSYREEYQAHVPICRKLHGEKHLEKEVARIQKKVEKEEYVPNQPVSSPA